MRMVCPLLVDLIKDVKEAADDLESELLLARVGKFLGSDDGACNCCRVFVRRDFIRVLLLQLIDAEIFSRYNQFLSFLLMSFLDSSKE